MSPTPSPAIVERLQALFSENFYIEPPAADVDLLDTGILDSLQLAELLALLEQSFDTRISVDAIDLEDLRTLNRIARLVSANGATA